MDDDKNRSAFVILISTQLISLVLLWLVYYYEPRHIFSLTAMMNISFIAAVSLLILSYAQKSLKNAIRKRLNFKTTAQFLTDGEVSFFVALIAIIDLSLLTYVVYNTGSLKSPYFHIYFIFCFMLLLLSNKNKLDKIRNMIIFMAVLGIIVSLFFNRKDVSIPSITHTIIICYIILFSIAEIWLLYKERNSDNFYFMAITKNCNTRKKCSNSCSFGAIKVRGSSIYIDKNICNSNLINCLPCAKACPEKAIKLDYEYQ